MSKIRKRIAVAVAAVAVSAVIPGIAVAAGSDEHCNFNTRTGEQRCFATLDEAVADAERPAGVTPADLPDLPPGNVIQGTFFTDPNYGGSSYTAYGEAPCEKDGKVEYQLNLPDDLKNKISSVQPWSNCWLWLYPSPDLGGDRDGPFKENTPDIGAFMNDRTQSVGFS